MPTTARLILADPAGVCLIRELDLPDPGPGEVVVQIDAATVEPAHVHRATAAHDGLLLMGSGASGLVLACGVGVTHIQTGDRVIVTAAGSRGFELRSVTLDDGEEPAAAALYSWGTAALLDARCVVRVERKPDKESFAHLGSSTLLAATAFAAAGTVEGAAVVVFGAGPVGLALVVLAKASGAAPIVAVDRNEKRRALATALGATHVVDKGGESGLAAVREALGGAAATVFDCVHEFSAKSRPGPAAGRAILVGQPGSDDEAARLASLAGYDLVVTEPDLSQLGGVLAAVESGALNPSALVTMRYTIESVNEAVRDLENGTTVGVSLLVMEPLR